jgi:hypothetical protein
LAISKVQQLGRIAFEGKEHLNFGKINAKVGTICLPKTSQSSFGTIWRLENNNIKS